ncbi:putative repeat protein (TIGR01451 family) [Arcticibacter tournemirensis]|nr:putative repeat protein (TIGR01451 family) [Arcticibacter tournemirensis]
MKIKPFFVFLIISLILQAVKVNSQTVSPFKLRYQTEQKGGIVYVSNTILSCENCDAVNELPPNGKSDNNNFIMHYIDIDASTETFSSSSADLILPDCSSITFAGLYWGGAISSTNSRFKDKNKIKLKKPGATAYIDLTADKTWGGQSFKDITSIVKLSQPSNGTFTVANVVADEGVVNVYAGWTIVIAYKHDLMPLRNLSVFEGLVGINFLSNVEFSISGFFSPPNGPVNFDFGFVAYDGDRSYSGDYLEINNQKVFDSAHNSDNLFNSSITNNGEVVQSRNPAYNNTLGYESSIIHLNNADFRYLKNGARSALINLDTDIESYLIGVLTASIDIYNPNIQLSHQYRNISKYGISVQAGETVELQYDLKNTGNDGSTNTVFIDTIPSLFAYVKGSIEVQDINGNWKALSDQSVDDAGEYMEAGRRVLVRLGEGANASRGGAVPADGQLKVRYKMQLIDDAELLGCAPAPVSKYGWLQYSGNVNPDKSWKVASDKAFSQYDCSGVRSPLVLALEPPLPPGDLNLTFYCPVSVADLALPKGYSLYKEDNTTASRGMPMPVAKISESGTYKAYRRLAAGCEFSYTIRVNMASIGIAAQPAPRKIVEGKSAEFSVETSGPDVKYQWQEDSGYDSWTDIPGATDRILTLRSVSLSKNRSRYRALISNPCGQKLVSYAVLLNVVESEEGTLFVPNAFRPNSAVEELTHFIVKGRKLSRWQMRVYNKWDQLIWETTKLNPDGSPAEGWDGKIGGQDAAQGIYLWAISAVFCDGSEWQGMSFNQSAPRKTGIVYLIR